MNIIKYSDYDNIKKDFFRKHKNDFTIDTTGNSTEYYRKTYVFNDGAIWYEVMTKVTQEVEITVNLCDVKVYVDLMQTEFWSADESNSSFYYEKWDINK